VRKLTLVLLLAVVIPVYSFTNQTTTERVLGENKEFIEFMNVCVSNFGEKDTDQFFEVYQKHFNAEVSYLQSDYKRSFHNIVGSQKINVVLFNKVLTDYYLEESKLILDKLAPGVIKSKNAPARLYLTLGYRDRAVAKNIKTMAESSRPHLRSYKIYNFLEAIKLTRRSMRYGMLALYESQTVEVKKEIFNNLLKAEKAESNPFYTRFADKNTDKEFVAEVNRSYDEYEKEYSTELDKKRKEWEESIKLNDTGVKKETDNKTVQPEQKAAPEKNNTAAVEEPNLPSVGNESEGGVIDKSHQYLYEKKLERRGRFRTEKKVAEYLRNGEFKQAEDIIRKNVEDFDYKLILATINIIQSKNEGQYQGVDFENLKLHHLDNNSRIAKKSIIDSFSGKVKVVDDISKNKKPEAAKSDNTAEPKTDNSAVPKDETPAAADKNTNTVNPPEVKK